jgi:DNA-binding NarL/FixJ family response regulator
MLNDGIRVLVVEDDPDWSQVLTSMIQRADSFHLVGSASNGIEAVEQAARAKPDLILLDIGLPKLNGLEAARQIRAVSSASKIIFVTQNSDPDFAHAALGIGGRGYILKSRVSSELLPAIDIVLKNGIFVSDQMSNSPCESGL